MSTEYLSWAEDRDLSDIEVYINQAGDEDPTVRDTEDESVLSIALTKEQVEALGLSTSKNYRVYIHV